jgi:uncharacterized protein YaeQ
MAQTATIYQMRVELTDLHRSVYESLSLRVARHASEDEERMVTRVLAYCLLYEEGMEFGRGVSDVDEPALWLRDPDGHRVLHWIDVGHPAADRIHRASKLADKVSIVCHKGAAGLAREARRRKIHRAEEIEVILLSRTLMDEIVEALTRSSDWTLIRSENDLQIMLGETSIAGSIGQTRLTDLSVVRSPGDGSPRG